MLKSLIYCRVSTEEQAKEGYSLDAQEKYCRQFAKRNSFDVVGVYKDEGKSGTRLDRPALKDLLGKAQKDKSINAVIVQETDRLARNTKDHLTIKALLQKEEVKLISAAQPMLDDSPEGMMIDTIIASVNQFQSDINSRKTKKGLQEKFDSGWWPGWAPIGYKNKKKKSGQGIIVPDPERWHLIKKAFKMYLSGNYSAFEIGEILYKKGLRSKTGKKMCNSIMLNTLRNPFYAGIMAWNGQTKQGKHKPMISLREHKSIIHIINTHNFHACRRRKHKFLLSGFIFCNICGGRYAGEKKLDKNISYYCCAFNGKRGKDKPHTNKGQSIKVETLEKMVEECFKNIQFNQMFIEFMNKKIRDIYNEKRKEMKYQKRPLLNQKQALEKKRDIAEEKLLENIISDEDFSRIRLKIEGKLNIIKNQLEELETKRTYDIDLIQEVLKLTRNIYQAYKAAPYELKRHYLELFWEKFIVQDRKIIEAIPAKLFQVLSTEREVLINDNWLPSPNLISIFEDEVYMTIIKEKVKVIKEISQRVY
jgi:site-specific DNA recombinase